MAARPKHQNKDYEALFVEAEANGWVNRAAVDKTLKQMSHCGDQYERYFGELSTWRRSRRGHLFAEKAQSPTPASVK